jgi:hypothetical protein
MFLSIQASFAPDYFIYDFNSLIRYALEVIVSHGMLGVDDIYDCGPASNNLR